MKNTYLLILLALFSLTSQAQLPPGSTAPDFTVTDINGNSHHLYDYLDNGQTVVLHFFATWSSTDWEYWNTGNLQAMYNMYGAPGTNEFQVLSIESDYMTDLADLEGTGDMTQGNYLANAPQPVIENDSLLWSYQVSYFPAIMVICPDHIVSEQYSMSPFIDDLIYSASLCGTELGYDDIALNSLAVVGVCNDPLIQFVISNYGVQTVENVAYTLDIDGTPYELIYDAPMVPGELVIVTLDGYINNAVAQVTVELEEDDFTWNNTLSTLYQFQEAFESTSHVRLDITTDEFPSDVTWTITDEFNNIVASGGPYYEAYTNYIEDAFLPGLGCYSFNLFDSSDNGIDTEELLYFTSVDDWGNSDLFVYDGTYEYGELHVPFVVVEEVPISISGYVFIDANLNGLMDIDEQGIGNIEVHLGEWVTFTNDNGGYAFNDISGDLTSIYIVYDSFVWTVNTTPTSYDLTNGAEFTYDFGLNEDYEIYGVEVWTIPTEYFVCDSENAITTMVSNYGNTTVDVVVNVTFDDMLSYVGAFPTPSAVNGNTVSWTIENLAPGMIEFLNLNVLAPGEEMIGEWVVTINTFDVTDEFGQLVDGGSSVFEVPFYCGFDPNGIIVDPVGETEEHFIMNDTEMKYTIYFQNTGTYAVQDVTIINTLDPNLNFNTIEITGASHAGQFNFNIETGTLEYIFHDVYLPDMYTDEPGSHGFLSYTISLNENLDPGTIVNNSAEILFDQNAPVVTNTVFNTIDDLFFSVGENEVGNLEAYPNPADEIINLNLVSLTGSSVVEITDATGKLVSSVLLVGGGRAEMDIRTLAPGLYQITVRDNNTTLRSKLMVK